ncbi:MAG: YlxR family protein [Ornithinimicrobium sp.]
MAVEAVLEQLRHIPLRTCVGCRGRDAQHELLRVVGVGLGASTHETVLLSPDPMRRAGGRGAYVHRVSGCIQSALRRRAFGRALRLDGRIEAEQVIRWIEQHHA